MFAATELEWRKQCINWIKCIILIASSTWSAPFLRALLLIVFREWTQLAPSFGSWPCMWGELSEPSYHAECHKVLTDLHKIGKYCSQEIVLEDEVAVGGQFLYWSCLWLTWRWRVAAIGENYGRRQCDKACTWLSWALSEMFSSALPSFCVLELPVSHLCIDPEGTGMCNSYPIR